MYELIIECLKSIFKDQIPKYAKKYSRQVFRLFRRAPALAGLLILFGFIIGLIIGLWNDAKYISNLNGKIESQNERIEIYKERLATSKDQYEQDLKIQQSMNKELTFMLDHKEISAVRLYYDEEGKKHLAQLNGADTSIIQENPEPPPSPDKLPDQPVHNENGSFNDSTEKTGKLTAQALATCLLMASKTYEVPAAVLVGVMSVEGGHVGEERDEKDGSAHLGPYMVSSKLIPELSEIWKTTDETAYLWIRDNGCVNTHVAAWLLRQDIAETGGLYSGIGRYHSKSKKQADKYTNKVIAIMEERGLIRHDK